MSDVELQIKAIFLLEEDELLLRAAADTTKRHNLRFILGKINLNDIIENKGAQVNYNKKERRFNFIQYTVKGRAKTFNI